ncbi:MAG: pilus assembly protein [Planctomycetota bacterium]|nr:pilus assembly protein [Planctomycetota bacterium]
MRRNNRQRRTRRGAEVLELSIVLMLFLLINFGIFEFGRMMIVQEIITNTAREGARRGLVVGATDAQALAVIDSRLAAAGITGYSRSITPSIAATPRLGAFKVEVSVPFNAVDWGVMWWLDSVTLNAEVEMRKE